MLMYMMADTEKGEVKFPVYHLVGKGIQYKVAVTSFQFHYIHCSVV